MRAVAYRMLGSLSEADDAVQESWLRLSRSDVGGIDNLTGWLTTVVARVCLNILRSRKARREQPLDAVAVPDGDLARQRGVVDAFLAAGRTRDFDALLAVLDPDVVLRADRGTPRVVRGARAVAEGALTFARLAEFARPALVNGSPGIAAWLPGGSNSPLA